MEEAQDPVPQALEAVQAAAVEASAIVEGIKIKAATASEAVAAITEVQTQAAAAASKIASDQAVIATKSDHIQSAQEHADTVRASLDRTLTSATKNATDVEGLRDRAQSAADSTAELQATISARKAAVEEDTSEIAQAKTSATATDTALKGLLDRARVAEQKVADYEKRLASLENQAKVQLQTITDLLPGATSAGLATAFDSRRKTFLEPSKRWQWLFVSSVVALVLLAWNGLANAQQADATFETLGRLWLARLPIAAALIWLALHAARESALAKRLEEDYGYKAAIAASFLGFNEQMQKIADEAKPDSPLAKLCSDTLATLASPPGRIYDKHGLTTTPAKEIKEMLEAGLNKAHEQAKPSA